MKSNNPSLDTIDAFRRLLFLRNHLKEGYFMKIWLSYNGTLSYTISTNLHPDFHYDKRWEPVMDGKIKTENAKLAWADGEVRRAIACGVVDEILKKEYDTLIEACDPKQWGM